MTHEESTPVVAISTRHEPPLPLTMKGRAGSGRPRVLNVDLLALDLEPAGAAIFWDPLEYHRVKDLKTTIQSGESR